MEHPHLFAFCPIPFHSHSQQNESQFRELVKVRYSAYFHTIQDTIPFFRTTQWLWFAVAIFYTYGDFIREIVLQGGYPDYQSFRAYVHFIPSLSFLLYSGTFVMTIATMQVGHIKFQLNQLCWTIVVLCLTGALKRKKLERKMQITCDYSKFSSYKFSLLHFLYFLLSTLSRSAQVYHAQYF